MNSKCQSQSPTPHTHTSFQQKNLTLWDKLALFQNKQYEQERKKEEWARYDTKRKMQKDLVAQM